MARSDLAFIFHATCLMFYVRTWLWHMTPAASALPGARGFGWFFRRALGCFVAVCLWTEPMLS